MKVLITGADGQLGSELAEHLLEHELFKYNKDNLDITNREKVFDIITKDLPDVIINCAAYTNVDSSESNYEAAYKVNVLGCSNLAEAAKLTEAKLIHISTDFVFNGMKEFPYSEYDATMPLGVYGQTKLAGEWAIRQKMDKWFILRTSWLYGKNGQNFVKTMIRLGKENNAVSVVTDQVGSPTYVTDLIGAIKACLISDLYGIYHFANAGECSWNEFAHAIFKQMGMSVDVYPTNSDAFIRPAKRPSYSVLDTRLIQSAFQIVPRHWEDALKSCLIEHRERFEN
jgi:dTDP-4-dehydrorhamnose reductase